MHIKANHIEVVKESCEERKKVVKKEKAVKK